MAAALGLMVSAPRPIAAARGGCHDKAAAGRVRALSLSRAASSASPPEAKRCRSACGTGHIYYNVVNDCGGFVRRTTVSDFVSGRPHTRRLSGARRCVPAGQCLRSVRRKLRRTTVSDFVSALVRVLFRHFRFFPGLETAKFCRKHRCLLLAGELGFEPRLTESECIDVRCSDSRICRHVASVSRLGQKEPLGLFQFGAVVIAGE
jgi:hypothetical protein